MENVFSPKNNFLVLISIYQLTISACHIIVYQDFYRGTYRFNSSHNQDPFKVHVVSKPPREAIL